MSSPSTSSTLGEGSSNDDHNQKNRTRMMMKKKKQQEEKKDRKVRVVSFRLSERDYERHLSMAELCYENDLTKGPDIVSYIRLSMECLWQYINNNSKARGEPSAEEKKDEKNRQQPQKKQEGGVEQQQDVVDYHTMTASSSSRAAAAANTAMREQYTRESIARTPPQPPPTHPLFNNLHEYFKPVFDEVDNLNKMLDSGIEEENSRGKEKKKK